MDKIKDFFNDLTFEKLLSLLTEWHVVLFLIMFIILIVVLVLTCIFIRTKKLRQIVTYEDNNVRYFSIHFDKNYVYSVDKRNLSKKRKENLEWFYNCFSPGEKVRLQVWLNELVKVDHTAPNHLEVTTKVKNVKQPIFTVVDVTHINYKDKIIHLESRLFPTIKKNKRSKNSKTNIVYYTEMPKILLDYEDNPRTLFLIRLSSLDTVEKENTDFDFTTEKTLGQDINADVLRDTRGYDHCYCIDRSQDKLVTFAQVREPVSGRIMTVTTDMPGVQLYTANWLKGDLGKAGKNYQPRDGFCLETQVYPDSPNKPNFPSCVLKAGEVFNSTTIYSFQW